MSSTTASAEEPVVPFGLDACTGSYFGSAVPSAAVAEAALTEVLPADEIALIQDRLRQSQPDYAAVHGVNPNNLAQVGWGVICTPDCEDSILEALSPLLKFRREQAEENYRPFLGSDGYRSPEPAQTFLQRHGAMPGPVVPGTVPYYLLLVGGPDQIPFSFQYRLDVQHSVGRICFETPQQYAEYAHSIVNYERSVVAPARRAVLFGPANPNDHGTELLHDRLLLPLSDALSKRNSGWSSTLINFENATKSRLSELLHGVDATQLLFAAAHGAAFPNGDAKQRRHQGSLICQDWSGPLEHRGPIPDAWRFGGEDVAGSANVSGMIAMFLACYSAGTPRRDYFPERSKVGMRDIAPADFAAWLPQRLLCAEKGAALAVIGHVERAWQFSFLWDRAAKPTMYDQTIGMLMQGCRVGYAMEHFGQRYAELGNDLSEIADQIRGDPSLAADEKLVARLWTARNDARSFVVFGDPAARFRLSD